MPNQNLTTSRRAVAFPSTVIADWMRSCVVRDGGDPATVPEPPYQFLRPAKAAELCGLHIATLWRMVGDGTLPKPIAIDRGLPLKKTTRTASNNQAA